MTDEENGIFGGNKLTEENWSTRRLSCSSAT